MLLSRSLPPHFLLPAWSTRKLLIALQRAHSSNAPQPPATPPLKTHGDEAAARYNGSRRIRNLPNKEAVFKKWGEVKEVKRSLIDDQTAQGVKGDNVRRNGGSNEFFSAEEEASISRPAKQAVSTSFFDQGPRIRFHGSFRGSESPTKLMGAGRSPSARLPILKDGASNIIRNEVSARNLRLEETKNERLVLDNNRAQHSTASLSFEPAEPMRSLLTDEGSQKSEDEVQFEQTKSRRSATKGKRALKRISKPRTERMKPINSLFDELFPDEKLELLSKQGEKKTIDKLPAFEWHDAPEFGWKQTVDKVVEEKKNLFHTIPLDKDLSNELQTTITPAERQRKSDLGLLVLSCASKTLEESDFFRLGSKGQHIEGWTSGILKVIQSRDTFTLEPLGHYFLIFSSEGAASAYLDHTIRLHRLSNTHSSEISPLTFPSKYLRAGEDIKQVLRGYSLVPGQSKLSLRLISRPYSLKVAKLLSDGGPVAIASRKTGSEQMVLFSVDWGRISHYDIRHAISIDGKRRNLHWKLKDGEKAIVKINDDQQNEDGHSIHGAKGNRSGSRNIRSPSRYILSFKESHEARRFVREWHRRPFPVQKEHKAGEELVPMMNAEMLW